MTKIMVDIQRLDDGLPLPAYAYPGDAGLDLRAACDVEIAPQQRVMIPTGIKLAIPEGYAGFVQPRSGLAAKAGLTLVNTPGLIDSHYRGEIVVIALNTDLRNPIQITKGDRIAQLVILAVPTVALREVDDLSSTERSDKGFGSSGV